MKLFIFVKFWVSLVATLCDLCCRDVNNDIMELMIIAYACRTSSASNIVGVIPYLPYSKQSKMRKRGCIVGKLLATMLGKAGGWLNLRVCLQVVIKLSVA